jgi:hypothetical protein
MVAYRIMVYGLALIMLQKINLGTKKDNILGKV